MALDRQGLGLTAVRFSVGLFFIAEGLTRYRWISDSTILAGRLGGWLEASVPGSATRWYLERVIPTTGVLSRVVPIGEALSGLALLVGFWTPFFAFLVFLLALNFHIASGSLFKWSFLARGDGLPVLGSTLALTIGGVRLPWSMR